MIKVLLLVIFLLLLGCERKETYMKKHPEEMTPSMSDQYDSDINNEINKEGCNGNTLED